MQRQHSGLGRPQSTGRLSATLTLRLCFLGFTSSSGLAIAILRLLPSFFLCMLLASVSQPSAPSRPSPLLWLIALFTTFSHLTCCENLLTSVCSEQQEAGSLKEGRWDPRVGYSEDLGAEQTSIPSPLVGLLPASSAAQVHVRRGPQGFPAPGACQRLRELRKRLGREAQAWAQAGVNGK